MEPLSRSESITSEIGEAQVGGIPVVKGVVYKTVIIDIMVFPIVELRS